MKLLRVLSKLIPSFLRSCPEPPYPPEEPFLVIGHRGSPRKKVENTLPSCKQAILRDGANGLEIDLCMTADGEIVLWHDWDPDSLVARLRQRNWEPVVKYRPVVPPPGDPLRRRVSRLTLEELRMHYSYATGRRVFPRRLKPRIPTLDEFLKWAVEQERLVFLILDIKVPPDELPLASRMAEGIARALAARAPRFRTALSTPVMAVLQAMKERVPGLEYCFDVELPFGVVFLPEECLAVKKAIELGNPFASVGRPTMFTYAPWRTYMEVLLCDIKMRRLHNESSGKPIDALIGWTINHPQEMRCLARLGLTGLLTDRPARLRRIARRNGRRLERLPAPGPAAAV